MAKARTQEQTDNVTNIETAKQPTGFDLSGCKTLVKKIESAGSNIDTWVLKRKEINDQIAAERAGLQAEGLNPKAFDAARAYMEMSPEQRENYDFSYAISRQVLGEPIQLDMFTTDVEARLKAARTICCA